MRALARRLALGAGLAAFTFWAAAASPARTASAPARGAAPAAAASAAPAADGVEFTGTLSTGTTYIGDVAYDARALKTWRPLREMKAGKNVAWAIDWVNIEKFPDLKTPEGRARPHRFRFRVVKTDSSSGSPSLPWMTTYRCEILAAEPLAAPAAPPPKTPPPKKR